MKHFLLVCTTIFCFASAYGQSDSISFYRTKNNHSFCLVALTQHQGIVFQLRYGGHPILIPHVIATDTLYKQSARADTLYQGRNFTIHSKKKGMYLTFIEDNQIKKLNLRSTTTSSGNQTINDAYWHRSFYRLQDSLRITNPWVRFSIYEIHKHWYSFPNKTIPFNDFVKFADAKWPPIRKQIMEKENEYLRTTLQIVNHADTLSIAALQASIDQLAAERHGTYVQGAVQAICRYNPETYFQVAEAMPSKKHILYEALFYDKPLVNKIRNHSTQSPIKREFLRKRTLAITGDVLSATYAITSLLGLGVLAGWGIHGLFK